MNSNKNILNSINNGVQEKHCQLAVLIDPDKVSEESLLRRIDLAIAADIDYFFVGGSLMNSNDLDFTIKTIKFNCKIPVILFPGSPSQINEKADAILLLSLISGRNPELLIGNHVIAAPYLKRSGLEILPTGYMLIDSGSQTTASYISQTFPIPANKPDIAVSTAMAGEMLGLKLIYLDGGSGAINQVNPEMIKAVRNSIEVPLIVGGGINDAAKVKTAFEFGANLVVVGNAIESDPNFTKEIGKIKHQFNTSQKSI